MEKLATVLILSLLGVIGVGMVTLLPAFLVMLVLGMLHANEGWNCNFSFWTTWGILFVVGSLGSSFNSSLTTATSNNK